jgi:hypothetical protein
MDLHEEAAGRGALPDPGAADGAIAGGGAA